jgi:hypothetical protein
LKKLEVDRERSVLAGEPVAEGVPSRLIDRFAGDEERLIRLCDRDEEVPEVLGGSTFRRSSEAA